MKHTKHAILWSRSSTSFYEARQTLLFEAHQAHYFLKNVKRDSLWSTISTPISWARRIMKHAKHNNFLKHAVVRSMSSTPILWSTLSTPLHEVHHARKHAKHASTPCTKNIQSKQARKRSI